MVSSPEGIRRRSVRGDFKLSRRSLVAAGALLVTVGSTRAAEAFARSSKRHAGFGDGQPGFGMQAATTASTDSIPETHCFLSGTRLLTPAGEVPIETLAIGDLLVTHDGEERPIRWIGYRSVRRDDATGWPEGSLPIRIQKDALGNGCPHRDLYVSRAHLLYLDGVLVPAGDLINGTTLATAVPDVDVIHYVHVELDRHDVLVAEGAPCDSLLPAAALRRSFDNYADYVAQYGASAAAVPALFAPLAGFKGGRSQLTSRMRSAIAPIVDIRRPLDVVRDDLEARASQAGTA